MINNGTTNFKLTKSDSVITGQQFLYLPILYKNHHMYQNKLIANFEYCNIKYVATRDLTKSLCFKILYVLILLEQDNLLKLLIKFICCFSKFTISLE